MGVGKALRFLRDEFIYDGHLLSAGAVSIVITSAILLNIGIKWDFMLIAYLITYIAYSYNKLAEIKTDFLTNPSRAEHINKYVKILPYAIGGAFLIIFFLLLRFGNTNSILFVLSMVLGSLLYTMRFKKLTQKIIGFKSFYVSLMWALLVFLLAFYYSIYIDLAVFLLFVFVFLRFIVATIFFDIKDIESDSLSGLKTIPAVLGKIKTFQALNFLNLFSFIPLVVGIYLQVLPVYSSILLIFYFYSAYYLILAKKENINIGTLSYIMVDGEYVLWFFLVIFSNYIFFK